MAHVFVPNVLTISVAQICQEAGWDGTKQSSLVCFLDVVSKFIEEIGASATAYSALAGRTQSNYLDFNAALEDIGMDVSSIMNYHSKVMELPFCSRLPRFPINKAMSTSTLTPAAGPTTIPPFLPALPHPRTYHFTPKDVEKETNNIKTRKRQIEENRKVEQSLTMLHHTGSQVDSVCTYNYQRETSGISSLVARTQLWGVAAGDTGVADKKRPRVAEPSPVDEGDQCEAVNLYLQPARKAKA
jgi:hypothetical protein